MRRVAALVVAVVLCTSCASDQPSSAGKDPQADCGFPTPGAAARTAEVPAPLLMDGAEVFRAQTRQGRQVIGLVVPHDVEEAFDFYRRAAKEVGYDVLQLDNEGFEAEIYLKAGRELAAFTIRSSACEGVVAVYLNLPVDG